MSWQMLSFLQLEGFGDEMANLPFGEENEGSFGSPWLRV